MSRTAAFAFALAVLAPATFAHAGYTPGRGLGLFDDRLVLGGYLALNGSVQGQERDGLALEDLSAFVRWQATEHLDFFSEFELEDSVHGNANGAGSGDGLTSLERLYGEWQPCERVRLRVGKMLTPIGIWNVIHAAPLVWTVSRPIATEQFFDTGITGAQLDLGLLRLDDVAIDLTAFGQATDQLDDTNAATEFHRAGGGRLQLALPLEGPRAGISFVRFDDDTTNRWASTYGGDFFWDTRLFEWSSEVAATDPSSGTTTWGAYVQVVYHAPWNLHPILRVEHADLGDVVRTPLVVGIAYKPIDNTVLKLESVVRGRDTELGGNGVLASLAVLF